jgi:hypothetical protein
MTYAELLEKLIRLGVEPHMAPLVAATVIDWTREDERKHRPWLSINGRPVRG